jgi:hypothetical protein
MKTSTCIGLMMAYRDPVYWSFASTGGTIERSQTATARNQTLLGPFTSLQPPLLVLAHPAAPDFATKHQFHPIMPLAGQRQDVVIREYSQDASHSGWSEPAASHVQQDLLIEDGFNRVGEGHLRQYRLVGQLDCPENLANQQSIGPCLQPNALLRP